MAGIISLSVTIILRFKHIKIEIGVSYNARHLSCRLFGIISVAICNTFVGYRGPLLIRD